MGINQMVDTIAAPGELKRSSLIAQFREYKKVFEKVRTAISVSQKSLFLNRKDATHEIILSKLEKILTAKIKKKQWGSLEVREVSEDVIFLNDIGTQSRAKL